MFAEIITIGDELLIGQVVDTNSAWMGQELNKIGIEVLRIVSIRDREKEILEAIDNAMERVNIVLVTGGLGPTKDDITKQTLCKYFHTELVFSEEVFENVKRVLAGKIPMNALNKSQAMVPKDCTVINNPVGSASVSWFERDGKVLVSMPGVPQEMTAVMTESVLPKLHERFQTDVIMHQTFLDKGRLFDALKNRPLVYCGGGSTFSILRESHGGYQDKKQISDKEWDTKSIPQIEEIISKGLCPILSTAYGLAISTEHDNIKMKPFRDIFEGIRGLEEEKNIGNRKWASFGDAYGGFNYSDDWDAWK